MIAARLTELAIARPLPLLVIVAAVTALSMAGTLRLESQSFLEGYLPQGDEELLRYRSLTDTFGSDRVAVFAIACGVPIQCDNVFGEAPLELLRGIETTAAAFPGVTEVQSVVSAGVLTGNGGTLELEQLGERPTPSERRRHVELVRNDPLLTGTLVSSDLRTAIVVVRFDTRLSDAECNSTALQMLDRLREIAAARGFELHASGIALLAASADEYTRQDLARLTPLMVLLLGALLVWIFRDPLSVGLALTAVGLPTVWSFGLMGWTGSPITPTSSILPILILVVGITDAVHFLVRVHDLRASRESIREVILVVAREVGPPTTITAATSALGFLSFLAGPMPNLREFGVFASIGIVGGWFLTFTLIPVALNHLRMRTRLAAPPPFALVDQILNAIRAVGHRHAGATIGVASAVFVISLIGLAEIVPDTDGWKLQGQSDPLVQSERFLRERLRPTETLEIVYEIPRDQTPSDADALGRLEQIEIALGRASPSQTVLSVLSVLRVAHREVAGSDLTLPTPGPAAAQLLLLAEAADSKGLRRMLSPDQRLVRLSVAYANATSVAVREEQARLREALEPVLGASWSLTGSSVLMAHVADVILENQIASFSTAFVTIFAVIFLFVRSPALGALGMIPNLFPVVMIMGFMGFTAINLDVGTAMIASILIGVSVDDTVYFLTHYQKARRSGADVRDAVAFTFAIAGKPAIFCAVVLSLGFFVLAFSSFQALAIFGLLSGFAVLLAVVAELFIMPAVLELLVHRRS